MDGGKIAGMPRECWIRGVERDQGCELNWSLPAKGTSDSTGDSGEMGTGTARM